MSAKIIICDDSANDIALLSSNLSAYDPLFENTSFTNGKKLVDEIMDDSLCVDILFLDIYMPEINGIEVAQKILVKQKDLKIIFLSSSKEHYSQAYDVLESGYKISMNKKTVVFVKEKK